MKEAFKRKKVKKEKNTIMVDLTGEDIAESTDNNELAKDVFEVFFSWATII